MYINIGEAARSGEWCDICKKMIYVGVWDHIAAHRRDFQRKEDERASREASERFKEICQRGARG